MNKNYKLKMAATRAVVKLVEVLNVIDASDLSTIATKKQIERHDTAECVFETTKPIAFDLTGDNESMSRFVIVDDYDISGGGIIVDKLDDTETTLKAHIKFRDDVWDKGDIRLSERTKQYRHKAIFVLITGRFGIEKREIARALERKLFQAKYNVYYLGMRNIIKGLDYDISAGLLGREELIRRLGELAKILTNSGQIFITTIHEIDDYDLEKLKLLNDPHEILVINVGEDLFEKYAPDLRLEEADDPLKAVDNIYELLKEKEIIPV